MAVPRDDAVLTLAAIRTGKNTPTEYLFNERERVFVLSDRLRGDAAAAERLRRALAAERPVGARLDLRRGTIERIVEPGAAEVEAFRRSRPLLDKPSRPRAIDLERIDPTKFNFVELKQRWPAFRLCQRTIPSYAKAKEIFDFCAQLSCHLPGPYAVNPCIPFQYVRDGCYARAHQMRRIITTRYRYCVEKVFSFANQDNDRLAVKASKWGGCCVTWWYHVAPLVRVRMWLPIGIRGHRVVPLTLTMVIDPGMFDKPVLLSTWLAAQQDTSCHANAHLSMYSIQPGTAYAPANYTGTAFSTDPSYTDTDSTLVAYAPLVTCP